MNYITELNKMYHWCMSKKRSKSEIALLQALYMIDNAEDWAVWFEADNVYIQRLTGGLSRESLNEARNKLKQQGRIDFKDGTRNIQSAKYMIIPFEVDMKVDKQVDMKVDIQVDKGVDIQVDKGVDIQVDTISKLNKTKQKKNICHSGNDDYTFSIDEEFESTYKVYPGKKAIADEKKTYILWVVNGRDIKGQPKNLKFNHIQIDMAVRKFAAENENADKQYIKHFQTFLNGTLINYVSDTREEYEQVMLDEFGENWRDIKFKYTLGGKEI